MPVQIQCTSVVIRNDALDRVLDGGAAAFEEIAPNDMSYADDMLSQASFMSDVDAEEFAKLLELRGLSRDSTSPDFVVVDAYSQTVVPPCDWLAIFEYEHRVIATMHGNSSRTVIAPASDEHHRPESMRRYSLEEIERDFEFVKREGPIDTYRNKATGQLVYHTRTTETPDEIFKRAFEAVWQHHRQPGQPPLSEEAARELDGPIADLQSLSAKLPDEPQIALALGMAWFAVGKTEAAKRHLNRGAESDPENTGILKELGSVCLERGEFDDAVAATQKAVVCQPDDPELLGNLAVSQLLAGQCDNAETTISRAVSLARDDQVNQYVQSIIEDVISGRRPQPKSLSDMMQPPPKKKSFLQRLFDND